MLLKDRKIFVVEDNIANKAITITLLESAGALVGFERWGTNTLSALGQFGTVDLILLDLMFPRGVTGYDVFRDIRAFPKYAHTPIVAVSAADASIAMPKARAMGFAGFIAKPVDFHRFPHLIHRVVMGEQVWESSVGV